MLSCYDKTPTGKNAELDQEKVSSRLCVATRRKRNVSRSIMFGYGCLHFVITSPRITHHSRSRIRMSIYSTVTAHFCVYLLMRTSFVHLYQLRCVCLRIRTYCHSPPLLLLHHRSVRCGTQSYSCIAHVATRVF